MASIARNDKQWLKNCECVYRCFYSLDNNSNVFSAQIKFENAINAVKERDFDAYVAVCKVP